MITGSNGQVGFELQRSLQSLGEIIACDRATLNLSNEAAIRRKVREVKPHIVINAGAWTAVDRAEHERGNAFAINAQAPRVLAQECAKLGIWMVHYSTDYVYPGEGEEAFDETAATGPVSVYGESKLAGDRAVIAVNPKHLIFRTSWVYAARGNNFMLTMLKLAMDREVLQVVADQYGSPTPASLIADVTEAVLRQVIPGAANIDKLAGVYHLAPRGTTSWCDFARAIISKGKDRGMALKTKAEYINSILTKEYPTVAMRPKNSRLAVDKLESTFNITLPTWDQSLDQVLDEVIAKQ